MRAALSWRRPTIIQNVSKELIRAKRHDEEERFYRETVAGATQVGQISGALGLAAERGDADRLMGLFEQYDRIKTGPAPARNSTGSINVAVLYSAISQAMAVCGDRKDYGKVLKLLDFNLEAARRKYQRQSQREIARARRARYASTGRLQYATYYPIWVGSRSTSVEFAFPQPDQYLDETNIVALRTAFELYKRDDLLSDLVQHFRSQALAATSPTEAFYPRLALTSILWWNDEKDEAVAELTKIVESVGPDSDLRFDLAELLVQQKSPADAARGAGRGSAARQPELEAAGRAGAGRGDHRRKHRTRPARRRTALWTTARYREPDPDLRADAPAWPS